MDGLGRALYAGDRLKRIAALRVLLGELRHADPFAQWDVIRALVAQLRAEYGVQKARDELLEWLSVNEAMRPVAKQRLPDLFVTDAEIDRVHGGALAAPAVSPYPLLGQTRDRYLFAEFVDEDEIQILYRGLAHSDAAQTGAADHVILRCTRDSDLAGHRFLKDSEASSELPGHARTDPTIHAGAFSFIAHRTERDATLAQLLRGGQAARASFERRSGFFHALATAIAKLHGLPKPGAHGDLRPSNILLDERTFSNPVLLPGRGLHLGKTNQVNPALSKWLEGRTLSARGADAFSLGKILRDLSVDLPANSVSAAIAAAIVDRATTDPEGYLLEELERDAEALSSTAYTVGKTALADYEIHRFIGAGRTGFVFAARDRRRQDAPDLALKLMRTERMVEAVKARFMDQRLLHQSHDNLVTVWAAKVAEGMYWEEMELLSGSTLVGAEAPTQTAIDWGMQIALACLGLHFHGSSRFDLRLDNLIRGESGTVKLIDYRIAARANESVLEYFFSAESTAPEMKAGRSGSPRSDVYALGLVLELLWKPRASERPDQDAALARLIELMKKPEESRPDMVGVYFELRRIRELVPAVAARKSPWPAIAFSALAAVAIALGVGLFLSRRQVSEVSASRDNAENEAKSRQDRITALEGNVTELTKQQADAATTLVTVTGERNALKAEQDKLLEIDEKRRRSCLDETDLARFDAACAIFPSSGFIDKRAALAAKQVNDLVIQPTLSVADARKLVKLKPDDSRALRTILDARSLRCGVQDLDEAAARVVAMPTAPTDLLSLARQRRLDCTPLLDQGPQLAEWYAASRNEDVLKQLLALDPDAGVKQMENAGVSPTSICVTLAPIQGPKRQQIANLLRTRKCGGMARLDVDAEKDVCVFVCAHGETGCACALTTDATFGQYDILKQYNVSTSWSFPGSKRKRTQEIPMTLESGIINFLYTRELRITFKGLGKGTIRVTAPTFDDQNCDPPQCSAGFLARQPRVDVTLEATPASADDVFVGWNEFTCEAGSTSCTPRLIKPRTAATATFVKKPMVRLQGSPELTIDGQPCTECRVNPGPHVVSLAETSGKRVVWSGCTAAGWTCTLDARYDGNHTVTATLVDLDPDDSTIP